jgi:hypothetical protein
MNMYTEGMNMGGKEGATDNQPPSSLTQFFEQENNWGGNGSAPAAMMNDGVSFNGGGNDDAGAPGTGGDAAPDPGNDAGPTDPCTGMADGTYCGGDGVSGDSSTLFTCANGTTSSTQVCGNGCATNGDQDGLDECN